MSFRGIKVEMQRCCIFRVWECDVHWQAVERHGAFDVTLSLLHACVCVCARMWKCEGGCHSLKTPHVCLSGKTWRTQRQSLCGYFNPTIISSREPWLFSISRIRSWVKDSRMIFILTSLIWRSKLWCFPAQTVRHCNSWYRVKWGAAFNFPQQKLCSQYLSNQQMKRTNAYCSGDTKNH